MGSPIDSYEGVGAYFTGAGGAMPAVWVLVCLGLVIAALVFGGKHEAEAYKRAEAKMKKS